MKKILVIIFISFLFYSNANTTHKGWPHGKKWAYNCAKTTDCNILIENISEQPKLFIGKGVKSSSNKPINIADKGNPIKPNKMVGIWGEGWKSSDKYRDQDLLGCGGNSCLNLQWSKMLDSMIYAPAINDGNEIFLNEQFKRNYRSYSESEKFFKPWRHALIISHLLQLGNFENLKQGLINGAKGKWLNELQPDTFLYQSGEYIDFQAYGNSLNWFYPTIIPLLEAYSLAAKQYVQ